MAATYLVLVCMVVAIVAVMANIAKALLEPDNASGPRRLLLIAAFILLALVLLGGNIYPYE